MASGTRTLTRHPALMGTFAHSVEKRVCLTGIIPEMTAFKDVKICRNTERIPFLSNSCEAVYATSSINSKYGTHKL